MSKIYNHKKIEKKWQSEWEKVKIYSPSIKDSKSPFYNLYMFPYPSGEGLHAGHAFSSTGSDVYGRYMRMHGKDVFQPIGYDSFGIHSENFALSLGQHPKDIVAKTTKNYERQLRSMGHGYDWTHTVTTSDIDYYRWTQWLFVQMFKAGLAYREKASVNWCPSCKTVLADEQVIAGVCERCETKVEQKELEQWFFRITDYADRLLENLAKIDWPERIKTAQTNWVGKNTGAVINFPIAGSKKTIKSFTTRPDTLYGVTFFVLSPEHPQLNEVTTSKYKQEVQKYALATKKKKKEDRLAMGGAKTGVFTGGYVLNPATDKKIPVYVADYVLMDYGSGAIMGVPAHDQRDWDFAKANDLPITEVISGGNVKKQAYDGEGKLINSGDWNGWKMIGDLDKVIKDLKKQGWGEVATSYHLRDWLISRQRYWGPPIPMIFCSKCESKGKGERKEMPGWYVVEEKDLPVKLPHLKDYKPKGTGRGPLADHPEFYKIACPECGGTAQRETDVSDTFLDSSWYFLRYPSVGAKASNKLPFDPVITKKWLPPSLYFGGAEHSVLHLMYARFVAMVLYDLKHIKFEEPFPWFFAHGLMIKDGAKMSKSRGNIVNPDKYIEKFGADAFRLYLMFIGPMDGSPDFRDTGIEGMKRFVERVWRLFEQYSNVVLTEKSDLEELLTKMHQTIKKVTEEIQHFRYNTAIAVIMEFVNLLYEKAQISDTRSSQSKVRCTEWDEALRGLVKLLAPFAPHMTEEVWVNVLGEKFSIHTSPWPQYDADLTKEIEIVVVVQIDGKVRSQLILGSDRSKDKKGVIKLAKEDSKIQKWLKNKKIKDVVFIPEKIVNFVTK